MFVFQVSMKADLPNFGFRATKLEEHSTAFLHLIVEIDLILNSNSWDVLEWLEVYMIYFVDLQM